MESVQSAIKIPLESNYTGSVKASREADILFSTVLQGELGPVGEDSKVAKTVSPMQPLTIPLTAQGIMASPRHAATAYQKQESVNNSSEEISSLQKYKDDQLLSNPGGDHYYLDAKQVITAPSDQDSFWGRIGKDLSDAFSNVKNFCQNLLFGSKTYYRDNNNQIQEASQSGLIGSVLDFFKDLGSAFSFGIWRPDGEAEPQGFAKRACYFFSKMKEAIFGDLIRGAGSIVHMGEDLLFAGWNALEIIPDATIGNFKAGQKLTTAIFDNGQVVLDYLTDIIPLGEAWDRVHSLDLKMGKAPILNNMDKPEQSVEDAGWQHIRNTPFRKTIETIGAILMDVLSWNLLGRLRPFGEEKNK